jgi:hypothetical protein
MKLRLLRALAAVPIFAVAFFQAGPSQLTITANAGVYSQLTAMQKKILSGFASLELNPATAPDAANNLTLDAPSSGFLPAANDGCRITIGDNVKANENCLNVTDATLQGRAQAQNETSIAQDPNNPNRVVASWNDYRRGDGNCYGSYSSNGGATWTDTTIPMGFTRGGSFGGVARQYWQAGGDTAVAWDTKGNAYFQCMVFMRGPGTTNNPDASSAVYVFRSTGNGGASWRFPGRPVVETFTNSLAVLTDKPYMTVDNHVGSPFQDRVYVTWTQFAANGSAYIFEASSNDYGEHFTGPVVVSGNNSSLCTVTFGAGTPNGNCNENQFSAPFTGSDGALYVAFDNFNNAVTGADNRNQVLLAKSVDGGHSFSAPVKVADYYDLPDCDTYQGAGADPFRACVPEKGAAQRSVFRAANYPSGAVNPRDPSQVLVTFGSYINAHSKETNGCVPAGFAANGDNTFTGVKTAGACNNKIVLSVSSNGGSTFTGTTTDPRALPTVNSSRQVGTDQWWQWATFSANGTFVVSYYDRQYGDDETTGFSDVSVSASRDLEEFAVRRATSGSMPLPTQFPDAKGNSVFFGDYTGLSAANNAMPLWMDTRNPDLFLCPGTGVPGVPPQNCTGLSANGTQANDEVIFTTSVGIGSGD